MAARTQVSVWRRRRKHGVGWQPMLAVEARGTRDSGAIDASDNQHDDEAATVIPEQQEHDQVHHDHAHAADELRRNATGALTHVHEHSHGEG